MSGARHAAMPRRVAVIGAGVSGLGVAWALHRHPDRFDFRVFEAQARTGGNAKVRLVRFKGLPRHTFHLHLKETEWRYNNRHADKYRTLLKYLRQNPLS